MERPTKAVEASSLRGSEVRFTIKSQSQTERSVPHASTRVEMKLTLRVVQGSPAPTSSASREQSACVVEYENPQLQRSLNPHVGYCMQYTIRGSRCAPTNYRKCASQALHQTISVYNFYKGMHDSPVLRRSNLPHGSTRAALQVWCHHLDMWT